MLAVAQKHFLVRNRITWEREKGRGSLSNWKNCSEDIWFCTVSDSYTYNVDAVKLKRKVIAPYTDAEGSPKDWDDTSEGNFRLTYPSNLWTDITVPFWSMPENTDHPTQKPEKLVAKIVLASSNPGDVVLDPFWERNSLSESAQEWPARDHPRYTKIHAVQHRIFGRILMATTYSAVVQQHGDWWIGWIEEVPGVNSQGRTREELLDNLRDALEEALEMNRAEARAAATGTYEEVSLPA